MIGLLIWPFLLNDFFFIVVQKNYFDVIAIDYGTRLFVVGVAAFGLWRGKFTKRSLGLVWTGWRPFLLQSLVLSVVGIALDRLGYAYFQPWFSSTSLFRYPAYPGPFSKLVDLSFGVLLVGLSEELVFRGAYLNHLSEQGLRPVKIVLTQAVVFGLIHWSGGVGNVVSAGVWGILPAVFVLRYRTLYPAVLAHYLTDLVAFM